jgi:hypothetical protein
MLIAAMPCHARGGQLFERVTHLAEDIILLVSLMQARNKEFGVRSFAEKDE